ncbi:hypothetical protein ES705_22050 [subsurface metagenome]
MTKKILEGMIREDNNRHCKVIEECRRALFKSMKQWEMGLFRDYTSESLEDEDGLPRILSCCNLMKWQLELLTQSYCNYEKFEKFKNAYKEIPLYADNELNNLYYQLGWFSVLVERIKKQIDKNEIIKDNSMTEAFEIVNGVYDTISKTIEHYKPKEKIIKEVREVILTVREKPKPQPKSTKFICFNCDKEYDKPVKVCEKCGFEFKK